MPDFITSWQHFSRAKPNLLSRKNNEAPGYIFWCIDKLTIDSYNKANKR